ncbi:MAG: DNA-directed RNA polymerase [Candidatus Altiarchaeales archaeon]|nr:MAG: DNA-directed RNA polymerase [Candidatus Altiarchaeales archaeon]
MYKIVKVEENIRVPPDKLTEDLEKTIISEFEEMYCGKIDRDVGGVILAAFKVNRVGEGKIIAGDGAVYYNSELEILVYQPEINEVVEGVVSEVAEFGAFINFGPMDGLVHVSQITEDFMGFDSKNKVLVGKESRKVLKIGDKVRARIISVSLKPRFSDSKIGLTMRQPYLGKLEWLEEERKKLEEKKK